MYKLLLCWRYLRTRYLALACVVSVMLGVATLIVVNSVMSGFSEKLKDRLHGLLSDIDVEAVTYHGFADPQEKMERIRRDPFLGDKVEAMTATMEIFAMLQFHWRGEMLMRPVRVIGIDPASRARVGGFAEHLQGGDGQPMPPSFDLTPQAQQRYDDNHRPRLTLQLQPMPEPPALPGDKPAPAPPPEKPFVPRGIIVGHAIAHFRNPAAKAGDRDKDITILEPGDDVFLTTISGVRLDPVEARFALAGYFRSEMSEYDANYVFVPLDYLQQLRTMENRATAIQIKLKDYREAGAVVHALKELFGDGYQVATWEDKQGPLLAAISIEKGLLNVLLFLIIAVAGFGILAIFSMIVVEKTRDIGILKSLGASNGGVMSIFLGYGLLLGLVGAGLGTALGLVITRNINWIEEKLTYYTGQQIFDRGVYYFDKIPTKVYPGMIVLVVAGALGVAVLFSVLPALRAALLHPVRALRYE
jgi:lipoprotein-releasing system permease protein